MIRRRVATVTLAAALVGGLGGAHVAASDSGAGDAVEGVEVRAAKDYWACVAVDHVNVGACVENPFPDLSQYPTVPELLDQLLGGG